MKKVVLVFGLIAGAIIFTSAYVTALLCEMNIVELGRTEIIGFTSMFISLSMIFFGIKSYRDNYGGGKITFWKGVQIGLLISAIASACWFAGGTAYTLMNPGFIDRFTVKFTEYTTEKMTAAGKPQAEIDKALEDTKQMFVMMRNPFIAFAIFFLEMFPIGVLISLISAAILRRRDVLPAAPVTV